MFKTSDLEKVLKYLKDNDIQEFAARARGDSFITPHGLAPLQIEFLTEKDFVYLKGRQELNGKEIDGKVYLIKQENL